MIDTAIQSRYYNVKHFEILCSTKKFGKAFWQSGKQQRKRPSEIWCPDQNKAMEEQRKEKNGASGPRKDLKQEPKPRGKTKRESSTEKEMVGGTLSLSLDSLCGRKGLKLWHSDCQQPGRLPWRDTGVQPSS